MGVGTVLQALFGGGDVAPTRTERTKTAFDHIVAAYGGVYPAMAHRVEWWPFGTVIRRASLDTYYKAMYIGDGSAITIDSHHEVISVNPDDWVSVPETGF